MVYKICCFITMVLTGVVIPFFLDKMITLREKERSNPRRYLICVVVYAGVSFCKIFTESIPLLLTAHVAHIVGVIVMLKCCYEDSPLVKTSAYIILMTLSFFADGLVQCVYYLVMRKTLIIDYSLPHSAFCTCMVLLFTVPLSVLTVMIWNKARKRENITGNTGILLLSCVSPPSILVMGMLVLFHAGEAGMTVALVMGGGLGHISILIVYILLIQSDRTASLKELAEIQRQSELERAHYAAVEEKREALARIRHDYRNVLTSVLVLMEGGNLQKARELLWELTEKVSATSEYPFCGIPVINAVLAEKMAACSDQGIRLQPKLLLPEALPVEDFDLCIILGNLIDNAIRACGGQRGEPEICLSVGVIQEYLVIKCENPVYPDTEQRKGTGYGQKILKSLAEKYHGNFLAEKREGNYTAQISLLLEKE